VSAAAPYFLPIQTGLEHQVLFGVLDQDLVIEGHLPFNDIVYGFQECPHYLMLPGWLGYTQGSQGGLIRADAREKFGFHGYRWVRDKPQMMFVRGQSRQG
jgi:hypothetical protein